jgi:hypothetical protein
MIWGAMPFHQAAMDDACTGETAAPTRSSFDRSDAIGAVL